MIRSILIVAGLAIVSFAGNAQTRPPALVHTDIAATTLPDALIDLNELDRQEVDFYWKDTSRTQSGVLRVEVGAEYLDLVSALLQRARKLPKPRAGAGTLNLSGLEILGELIEDEHRINIFFATAHGPGMLTVWHFADAGAKIVRHREFLNVQIRSNPATLSLAQRETDSRALWKLTWLDNGVQYELYVPDLITEGAPSISQERVIQLAEQLR